MNLCLAALLGLLLGHPAPAPKRTSPPQVAYLNCSFDAGNVYRCKP